MEIQKYLVAKGLKPSLSGFRYLVKCIKLCKDATFLRKPLFQIYGILGEENGIGASTVARCITYVLEQADIEDTPKDFIIKTLIDLSEE